MMWKSHFVPSKKRLLGSILWGVLIVMAIALISYTTLLTMLLIL